LARRRPPALCAGKPVHLSLGGVRVRGGRPGRPRDRAGRARDRARIRAHRKDGDRRRPRAAPGRPAVHRAVQRVAHAPRGPQLMTLRLVGRAESAHVCALIEAITQELYSLPYPEEDWSGGWVALDGNAITGMVKTFDDRIEDLWVLRD